MTAVQRRRYAKRLRPHDRREAVLDAALQLVVEERSFHVTMEAIAATGGVSKPVVYDYFANRDELLAALLQRELERAFGTLMSVVPNLLTLGDAEPEEILVERTEAFLEAVLREPDTWRLLLLPPAGAPGDLGPEIARRRENARQGLKLVVTWGAQRRPDLTDLDVDLFTHLMLAVGERAAELVLADPAQYPPERIGKLIRTFFVGRFS